MEYDDVMVRVDEKKGLWYWSFFFNGKQYQCNDKGLPSEALARNEGQRELDRLAGTQNE